MEEITDLPADNPCWGGPEPHLHDLQHLLNVLAKTTSPITSQNDHASFLKQIHQNLIIFQDGNYLVINKPPDLRMDGPYRSSVHKLLLYLFPHPSLLPASDDDPKSSTDCTDVPKIKDESRSLGQNTSANHFEHRTELLQKISVLSKHSCLKDDPFRIVHQLDYATSGILLYAKNKRAAGVACCAFQQRKTDKQYVAVVVNPDLNAAYPPFGRDFLETLQILPSSKLKEWEDGSLENKYRKKRKRETEERAGKKTFDGFMPVHSVFAKWRGMLLRLKKEKESDGTKQHARRHSTKKKHDLLPPLPELKPPLTNEEVEEVLSYGASWKAVKGSKDKKCSRCWVAIIEDMAKEYNQLLAEFHARKDLMNTSDTTDAEKGGSATLPPLFRMQSDDDSTGSSLYGDSFYISASIGEPKDGRFEVLVDPDVSKPLNNDVSNNEESAPLPEMKPSLTKCTVLWRGHMQINGSSTRIPVTKVLLKPWTGRRHQLRVHLAQVAGFPILGDVTYGGNIEVKCTKPTVADDGICSTDDKRVACRRMCLHAKQLSIPLMDGEVKSFEAPDPFVIGKRRECEEETLQVL